MAGEKVLIVEDNGLNMELAADLLGTAGYSILKATTAEEGIWIAKDENPALILMDIGLPGMDGLTATRILSKDPSTKQIRVVALTSHAMVGDKAQAMDAGCCGYITKPIDTRVFVSKVAEFMDSA
jgi:two-component system cell cycle response regulator DivK